MFLKLFTLNPITYGGFMKKIAVLLMLVLAFGLVANVSAQDIGFYSVGGKVSLLLPEEPWGTGFALGAVANLGEITQNLQLVPSIDYWFSTYDHDIEGAESYSMNNLQISGDVHYLLEDVEGLYFGGGMSLNFTSWEHPSFDIIFDPGTGLPVGSSSTKGSESKFKVGINLLGGYEMPIGKNTGFAEAKYNVIGSFNTFELCVGMFFDLNK
jgi:hypothetical protein